MTIFTRAHHWSLSWGRWIEFTPSHPFHLRSILQFRAILSPPYLRYVLFISSALVWSRYRMSQKSVNWLVKCTLKYVRSVLISITVFIKFYEIGPSMFNAQLTALWYRSTYWLAGLNLNVPVNSTVCFGLTDFWATLHNPFTKDH
jgi:hypothetical protein